MRLQGIACVFRGHRWVQAAEFHEAYPVFECSLCGRSQAFAPGTSEAGIGKRAEAQAGADKLFPGRR
ncbi:MAG: hypothetical protein JOY73_01680 [Actinobacteria bacterium]|nr:hypothetical protein [Actinomycetota bacterium]